MADAAQLTPAEVAAVEAAPAMAVENAAVEWDSLPDADALSPADTVALEDLRSALERALDRLPAGQSLALRRYYLEDATLDAIAGELGVSRERARQLRAAGEKRLRADLVVLSLWQSVLNQR